MNETLQEMVQNSFCNYKHFCFASSKLYELLVGTLPVCHHVSVFNVLLLRLWVCPSLMLRLQRWRAMQRTLTLPWRLKKSES